VVLGIAEAQNGKAPTLSVFKRSLAIRKTVSRKMDGPSVHQDSQEG